MRSYTTYRGFIRSEIPEIYQEKPDIPLAWGEKRLGRLGRVKHSRLYKQVSERGEVHYVQYEKPAVVFVQEKMPPPGHRSEFSKDLRGSGSM